MKVNNIPDYARKYAYTVVRMVNNAAWFYGAWNDLECAARAAYDINGHVIPTHEIEPNTDTRPAHSGFEAEPPAGAVKAYPRGTTFRRNTDNTITPISPRNTELA
ncbi:MAG: hypothetical protein J6W84_03580 [Bacteroidales bacterium]|nr:hypothetical protein [Bacteroidales bacterium]